MAFHRITLVFSHLRWGFVYQRPQHLLSRLAHSHGRRILYIEEPVHDDSEVPFWERRTVEPNVTVYRPHTPGRSVGFTSEQQPLLEHLLNSLLEEEGIGEYTAWLYTPMALPLLKTLRQQPGAVVYDCMDELSAFLGAPAELIEREAELFQAADVVFTGGPSLYRSKKDKHRNVHCFPSSVDVTHFAEALKIPEAPDQAVLPHPRLGYFGVIDERMDLALIERLAGARPGWQLVMVGPVVKIEPARLPRRPNIHWMGQRSYSELPGYLAGWDVCLLPFARNEATRFISPTKTLEYMAAERMIVSTPIADVAEPYGGIVFLGATPEEFISACEQALNVNRRERSDRLAKTRAVLARTSWDLTAARIEDEIAKVEGRTHAAGLHRHSRHPAVIVGAGPTGLSAAFHLGADALLLEQNDRVGGWCRSVEVNGFTFDYAGHIMFSNEQYVHDMYKLLLGENVHWQDREAWIYSKNVYTRYPFQGALYGLPAPVITECIVGAIEARFGSLAAKPDSKANGKPKKDACTPGTLKDCCADGILEAEVPLATLHTAGTESAPPRNFEEFIYRVWGAGIAKHFAIPYNRKLWTVPLSEMETSWLGGRVPMPDLEEMIEGALRPIPRPMGPNARFGYPLRGGFQALMDAFLDHLKGELRLNTRVVSVSPSRRTLTLHDGREIRYEQLISTMPLPALVRAMGHEAPEKIRAACARLRHVSVRCVHLGVGRPNLTEKHWIYYPEDTVFHRVFVQGNASPHCNPPGGFGLTCEITYSPYKPLPVEGEELIRRCIEDCRRVGLFAPEDPVWATAQCDLPYAYVVYDHARAETIGLIREWMEQSGILLAGRYSEWEYYNSDHAFIAGKNAAAQVRASILRKEIGTPASIPLSVDVDQVA
jgi:UDP-galactopyranose mutase